MKKLLLLVLILMIASATAMCETYVPEFQINMEGQFEDGIYDVGFTEDDMTEKEIFATIYETIWYDTITANFLQVGDVITVDGEVTVNKVITNEFNQIDINDGFEYGGITLTPADEGGMYYVSTYDDYPVYVLRGQAQLLLADEVTLILWYEDEDGTVAEDDKTVVVPANQVKDTLITMMQTTEFVPGSATVELQEGKIVEIHIEYAPFC